ncbi:MAG: hypothetical protein WBA91_04005 [Paracoccaceae bacterium]
MSKSTLLVAAAFVASLAGCMESDGDRALAGAAAGAVLAGATDNNVLVGAGIGAAAGALCDDANVCN